MAACGLVALACTVLNLCSVSLLPPRISPRDLRNAGAEAHVLVDRQTSTVQNRLASRENFESLDQQATMFANLLTSQSVRAEAAHKLGIDVRQVAGSAPVTFGAPAAFTEPGLERRANDIEFSRAAYRIVAEARSLSPEIDVYTAAPTIAQAERLADATIAAAQEHLHELTVAAGLDQARELASSSWGRLAAGAWRVTPRS